MRAEREANTGGSAQSGAVWILAALAILAALHAGRDVFIPMALALLLSVVLIPPARAMQRAGLPRAAAVILLLVLALGIIVAVLLLVTSQVLSLAADLPNWETTLREKLAAVSAGSGVLDRAVGTLRRLSEELSPPPVAGAVPVAVAPAASDGGPLVAVIDMAGVLAGSIASLAIALLLMAYLLMQREDVRDRFLRLAGLKDLHRTTRAMADATERVGRYLLLQMAMNAIFGLGMGIGTAMVGVPNAPLWGVLAFVLRFIPFVGAWVALLLPLTVAIATIPGWMAPLMVLVVFAVVDGIVTHVLEPLLYGRGTGISPLALLISSALWTVLWGPIGLLLAPPITACLAIVGRHVPALGFLEILLGNGEALPPPLRFYQRFLARDAEGAIEIAENYAEAEGPAAAIRDLVMPAVSALAADQAAGVLAPGAVRWMADSLASVASGLAGDRPSAEDAPAVAILPVAGGVDEALAAAAAAAARLHGWRTSEAGAAMRVVCTARPTSAIRLRRIVAKARRDALPHAGFAPDEAAAAQLGAALRPAPVLRTIEALGACLDRHGAAGARPRTDEAAPGDDTPVAALARA